MGNSKPAISRNNVVLPATMCTYSTQYVQVKPHPCTVINIAGSPFNTFSQPNGDLIPHMAHSTIPLMLSCEATWATMAHMVTSSPDPLGPSSAQIELGGMSTSIPSTALNTPLVVLKCFTMSRTCAVCERATEKHIC